MAETSIKFDCGCLVKALKDSKGAPKDVHFFDKCDHHRERGNLAFLGWVVLEVSILLGQVKNRNAKIRVLEDKAAGQGQVIADLENEIVELLEKEG